MTGIAPFPAPGLVDIGANLTHDSFDDDREQVISRAREADVNRLIVTGSDVMHSRKALELARSHPGVLFATAGVHPHHAKDVSDDTPDALRELLQQPEAVAVGECGLDYFRDFSPRDRQREVFDMQLALASEVRKPVFLHQREAHDDFMVILRRWRDRIGPAVVHCFTGTAEELRDYLDLDCHIGITGWICDERRGRPLRERVRQIPPERLMIETDAPYLLPRDLSPKPASHRNEPMYLAHVCDVVARCLGKTSGQLAQETTANAERFFSLPRG